MAWLRSRPTLLILDNCEHVLDHAAALVAAIEAGAPEATVLATSREPLGLPGEVVRRVPSLDPATDAVQLFAERAATASDGFVLDDTNRPVVSAICARLDGIPLAIELAAARVRALTPAEILARLDDRFRLLRSSGRGGHERHQTLLATVTWSVQLLSPEERCLFERLSVFAGSFSLGDAEAVCGFDPLDPLDVVDLLSALVDRSMVVAEAGPDGATRYRLLETLRQYGEQALAADASTATMRDRHLAHFLGSGRALVRASSRPPRNPRPTGRSPATGTTCGPRSTGRWPPAAGVTWPTCCTPPTGSPFTPAGGNIATGPSPPSPPAPTRGGSPARPSRCGACPAQSDAVTEALAALDPTAPDLRRPRRRTDLDGPRQHRVHDQRSPTRLERAAAWIARTGAALRRPDHRSLDSSPTSSTAHCRRPTRRSSPASIGSARPAPVPASKRSLASRCMAAAT